MGIVSTKAISAENQWSDVFELQGDSGHISGRRAGLCASVANHGATVTVRRYNPEKTEVIGVAQYENLGLDTLEVPVTGPYDIGVATGDYGSTAFTITVEQ